MISLCLSLVALGLVSLAGCQVEEPSDLETAAETIQVVPSLPGAVISRKCCCFRVCQRYSNIGILLSC